LWVTVKDSFFEKVISSCLRNAMTNEREWIIVKWGVWIGWTKRGTGIAKVAEKHEDDFKK
jgi:hypothetical protein